MVMIHLERVVAIICQRMIMAGESILWCVVVMPGKFPQKMKVHTEYRACAILVLW